MIQGENKEQLKEKNPQPRLSISIAKEESPKEEEALGRARGFGNLAMHDQDLGKNHITQGYRAQSQGVQCHR